MSQAHASGLVESVGKLLRIIPDPDREYRRDLERWAREEDRVSQSFLKKIVGRDMTIDRACELVEKHDPRERHDGKISEQTVYALRDLAAFLKVDETRGHDPSIDGAFPKDDMLIFGKSPKYSHVSVALHLPMYHFRWHYSKIEVYSPRLESVSKNLAFQETSPGYYSAGPITIAGMIGSEKARLIEDIEKRFGVEHSISQGHRCKSKHLNGVPLPLPITWGIRFHWSEFSLDHREHLDAIKTAVVNIDRAYQVYVVNRA